ncbi:DUF3080 family protein [Saccharospirillum sp. MSK14-1]|uniref:DUF3080 family protein n=1 Tax=Saccharospirillum sp. MSK14-1 TaxID=1897632 RepID=UPI0013048157|nr:DUF3080 family protein [Saccharospirillum sp. MSK14-1]
MQRLFRIATSVLVALLLSGCERSAEALLDDYVTRVGRVLDAEPPAQQAMALPVYPRPRELLQSPQDIRLDLLDAWALRGCEVFVLIGERNSILGKLADPVIRLDYERRLLELLPACLNSDIELGDELRTELDNALAQKRATFHQHLWNATLANPDYSGYWTDGSTAIKPNDDIDAAGYATSQQALADLVANPMQSTQDDWLNVLQQTTQYPMGGHSLQSMRLAIQTLQQAEAMLNEAAADKRLCPMGPAMKEFGYARNVMANVFVGEVQPWLGEVDRRFLAGFNTLQALTDALGELSVGLTDYQQALDILHDDFRTVIRAQVQAWQSLIEACGGEVRR